MSPPQVTVNQKGATRIQSGHPWVFQSDVVKSDGATPGFIVEVVSEKNKFLGQAFFNPRSKITLRIFSRNKTPVGRDFWKQKISSSIQGRNRISSAAKRLVHGEADGLPSLIVDRYKDVLVFQTLSLGMDRIRDDLISILDELLQPSVIVERNDAPVRDLEGLVRQKGIVKGGRAFPFEIEWGGKTVLVDPLEGQKTGLFLDQADNHEAARRHAAGSVLDLFCYQGGFSLAIAEKVETILAVDSSAQGLTLLRQNCLRNQIENVQGLESNVFDFLREREKGLERYDTIILDPPPFVRGRQNLDAGLRGYKEINLRAMKLLKSGGILIACSCSQNFTPDLFSATLLEASRDAKKTIQVLERRGASPDHPVLLTMPESSYLQCWMMRCL